MGLFHCPIGAAYYDDDVCIDCGLCNATTSEQKVEASKKLREYIRSNVTRDVQLKKIAVCGKGGTGKSTITALLSRAFVEHGYRVIVLDSDDSNQSLNRMLGIDGEPRPLAELFAKATGNGNMNVQEERASLSIEEIRTEYKNCKDGISFMLAGKIFDPFQGCACSLAESASRIVEKLVLREKDLLVMDTEAGVESFGRGVERYVDTVLAVVEPSFDSIELAIRINTMAQGMGIKRVGAVLNKIIDADTEAKIVQKLEDKGMNVFGVINNSNALVTASFEGKPILLGMDLCIHDAMRKMVVYLTSPTLPGKVPRGDQW